MIKKLQILWKFSRPHTIIGSIMSITTLYLLALKDINYSDHLCLLVWTIITGIACNIFIVGLNQMIDVESDKINKPYLPLASGELAKSHAKRIIISSLILTLVTSFLLSYVLGILILIIVFIGIIYSVPPIQLKRHHLPAALSITLVRGLLVNVGMFFHFRYAVYADFGSTTWALWVLTGFVILFSVAIAWFKDLPDVAGDRVYSYKTLAVLYSEKFVFRSGFVLLSLAYICTIYVCWTHSDLFLFYSHIVLFLLFLLNVYMADLKVKASIVRFYMYFWVFFFAEYIVFAIWSFI
ncbi:MAG: homogentisate phytyltransferase [Saprospiraceae bacterium]|nr:homogentisate phytyltransferase [Saprospiraceae bacterium]